MARFLLLAGALVFSAAASAQPLLEENFDYPVGDRLTEHGWTNHSGTGDSLKVIDDNLTFPGYPSVTGNSSLLEGGSGSREDANRQTGTALSTGSAYVAFLVEPTSATTADYFLHGSLEAFSTSFFRGRVYVREVPPSLGAGSAVNFGISKSGSNQVFTAEAYPTGATYLLVLKYTFNAGADDDTVDLFVFEAGDDISVEPGAADASDATGTDLADFGSIALRQGSNAYSITVDGIRFGRQWDQAVIPVELTSFTATTSGTSVNLAWETASETNNAGFEVQMDRGTGFEALAFVDGHGTTTEARTYSHTATDLAPGAYAFRLKQIDFDGAFEYSDEVEATIEVVGTHVLNAAYPNPFNPQATFTFAASQAQQVTATLYNALGQRVAVLFDGSVEADQTQTVAIDGAGLSSGLYVVRVEGERFSDALRVTLLK